MYIKQDKIV